MRNFLCNVYQSFTCAINFYVFLNLESYATRDVLSDVPDFCLLIGIYVFFNMVFNAYIVIVENSDSKLKFSIVGGVCWHELLT